MPYKSGVNWTKARAFFESGHSQGETARRFGVSRTAVQHHLAAEGWTQDVGEAIAKATESKLAGIVAGGDPVKTAAALDSEAERRAAVIIRHRAEWHDVVTLRSEAFDKRDFEGAKLAKITAETLMIQQGGERKAWGFDQPSPSQAASFSLTTINVRTLATEDLEAIVATAVDAAPAGGGD